MAIVEAAMMEALHAVLVMIVHSLKTLFLLRMKMTKLTTVE